MRTEFAIFGDPSRFEIALRWVKDSEALEKLPARHGWSMGDLRITIAGQTITASNRGKHVSWYLAPVLDWVVSHWAALLHEEDYSWIDRTGAPAVIACHRALDRGITLRDDAGRAGYRAIQAWYLRHALRSAAEGGLFPDLFVRRLVDDVELSWSAEPPLFAPDGFAFSAEPGVARLPVNDVAGPLWEALQWAASVAPEVGHEAWQALVGRIEQVPSLDRSAFDSQYVDAKILAMVRESLDRLGKLDLVDDVAGASGPYLDKFSPAVAMFGGVNPDLGAGDVHSLCELLADSSREGDNDALIHLVDSKPSLGIPHEEGYSFAENLLEELRLPGNQDWIDIRSVVGNLGIDVRQQALETDSIRGIAIAGQNFRPVILVNATSPYNINEDGRRFTIAHELCHILHDRTRARRVTHVSGRWVDPGIERRANAFAAYLLMPRQLIINRWRDELETNHQEFKDFAAQLRVSEIALLEHLYNQNLIDELARERLRSAFRFH